MNCVIKFHHLLNFQTFQKLNVEYLTIEIQDRPDCNEIQDALEEITGARSVPRVFVDGKIQLH